MSLLELLTDLFHMLVYLAFFVLICTYYGLPLHIMRDLYLTIRLGLGLGLGYGLGLG